MGLIGSRSSQETCTKMSETQSLVSVIVPTYRRVPYLIQTVQSILSQTYATFELLIVADGHDQEVAEFVSGLADDRVIYLACPHAGRPSVPRNCGIERSRGEYIAFCDDDDLWEKEKLAKQISLMKDNEVGFSYTASFDIDQNGARAFEVHRSKVRDRITKTRYLLSLGGMIPNSSIVVSREVLNKAGPLNESADLRAEDYEICARFLGQADAVGLVEPLVGYRTHAGSIQPQSTAEWLRSQRRLQSALWASGSAPMWTWSLRYLRVFYWVLRLSVGRSKTEFARWHSAAKASPRGGPDSEA
jgi:teichuronic acid biosynthesis glycosyltransferase TuaG